MQDGTVAVRRAGALKRHRSDRIAVRRKPVDVSDEELTPGLELDDRSTQRAPEPPEHVVTPLGRIPFDGVAAERPWHAERPPHLPPRGQRLMIEERVEHH